MAFDSDDDIDWEDFNVEPSTGTLDELGAATGNDALVELVMEFFNAEHDAKRSNEPRISDFLEELEEEGAIG